MVVCHSVQRDGLGLPGGRKLNKHPNDKHQSLEEWIQAPLAKQEKKGFVTKTKSTDDYIVKHIARHFLIAADRCNQHRDEMSSATDHMK